MKLQYLGDSKDSFTWDYLDFLIRGMAYSTLNIVWMLTPDDGSGQGSSAPELFPASDEVLQFCHALRQSRDLQAVKLLPNYTRSGYAVAFHKGSAILRHAERKQYFTALNTTAAQHLFVAPDNGFEPEKSFSAKHVSYSEVLAMHQRLDQHSIVTIFQHHRRKRFADDFACISQRLGATRLAAVYWHACMFVTLVKTDAMLARVEQINQRYAVTRPVNVVVAAGSGIVSG